MTIQEIIKTNFWIDNSKNKPSDIEGYEKGMHFIVRYRHAKGYLCYCAADYDFGEFQSAGHPVNGVIAWKPFTPHKSGLEFMFKI